MPVPPEIMNRIRAESGVGKTVTPEHHKPRVREQKPEETENLETTEPTSTMGRMRRLFLEATGVRNPEESA